MNDSIKYVISILLGIIIGLLFMLNYWATPKQNIQSEQFGGNLPMKIYQVYDKDTGVYYAVTEKGGICVMKTMIGETKLVDEGEPPIIHKNQGE